MGERREEKVVDLMQALMDSVDAAKSARRRAEGKPVPRCMRCQSGIGGCMTEGCPGPASGVEVRTDGQ